MIKLNCENCETDFSVYPSRLRAGNVRFCSAKCCRDTFVGNKNPNWKGGLMDRKCLQCGQPFKRKQKEVRKTGGNFCSLKCSMGYHGAIKTATKNNRRVKKSCVVCNKNIFIKPSHAGRGGTYCSKTCQKNDYKQKMLGSNNPNFRGAGYSGYKNNSPIRRHRMDAAKAKATHTTKEWNELRLNHNFSCAKCGKQEPEIKLTKDHIVPISKGGNDSILNIQPLCQRCNAKKHKGTTKYIINNRLCFDTDEELLCSTDDINLMIRIIKRARRTKPELLENIIYLEGSRVFVMAARGEYHGMFIEMKAGKNKCTPEQLQFLRHATSKKYYCDVCYSFDEFKETVENYLGL